MFMALGSLLSMKYRLYNTLVGVGSWIMILDICCGLGYRVCKLMYLLSYYFVSIFLLTLWHKLNIS